MRDWRMEMETNVSLYEPISEAVEAVAHQVIGGAIEVHRAMGPGYIEGIYHRAMVMELRSLGLSIDQELATQISYKGTSVGSHRADLVVGGVLVVEIKAVRQLEPIHTAQVASYLKAFKLRLGLLINFNVAVLKQGIRRVVR